MLLYLMRHGDASPVGGAIQEDVQRLLSPAGRVQVRGVAEGLKRRAITLDAIVSSPLVRAQQTARIVADVLGLSHVETYSSLAPNASSAGLPALLAAHASAQGMLLIGHHPDVTFWTAFLTGLDSSACPLFGTASLSALQLKSDGKKAEFLWFQTSEQLSQE